MFIYRSQIDSLAWSAGTIDADCRFALRNSSGPERGGTLPTQLRGTAGEPAFVAKVGETLGVFLLPNYKEKIGVPSVLGIVSALSLPGLVVTLILGHEDTEERVVRAVEMAGESDTFSPEVPMEIPKQLIDCLDQNKVQYEVLHHSDMITAQRIAQAEHIKGRHQAKVVMVKSGDQHLMIVLSADHHIDLEKIEKAIGKPVSLGRENDFKSLFPDSVVGAMPPFGNLYGLPTYVDKHLAEQNYIVFEAGTHTDAIKMSYSDYERIVKPKVEDLGIKFQPMKGA